MCMNNEMASIIGSKVGKVLEVDPNGTSDCLGKFLRIRIRIMLDITKPLKKGVRVNLQGANTSAVLPIFYEKLLEFCIKCGCVGHLFRDCAEYNAMQPLEQGSCEFPYKEWMQANAVVDKTKNKYRGRGESSKVKSPDEMQDRGNNSGESDPNLISQPVQDQTHDPAQKVKKKQDDRAEVEWSEADAICIKSNGALMVCKTKVVQKVPEKLTKSGKIAIWIPQLIKSGKT